MVSMNSAWLVQIETGVPIRDTPSGTGVAAMFERNVIDRGSDASRKSIALRILFDDGREVSGLCFVVATRTLDEELNQPGLFLDFEPYEGERAYISKSSIKRISQIDLPKADQLTRTGYACDAADPYAILNVQRGELPAVIQAAYHRLAKQYHPDRFAGLELPSEMATYAADMSRRINEAYSMLLAAEKEAARRHAEEAARAAAPKNAYEEFQRHAAARYA